MLQQKVPVHNEMSIGAGDVQRQTETQVRVRDSSGYDPVEPHQLHAARSSRTMQRPGRSLPVSRVENTRPAGWSAVVEAQSGRQLPR